MINEDGISQRVVLGGVSGFLATVPMSIAMQAMFERLPFFERYRLPPERISVKVLEEKVLGHRLGEPEHSIATTISHFGYGTACGLMYGAIGDLLPLPPVLRGMIFGA